MNEESIFAEALGKADTERDAYLAAACGDDPELRGRIEALLQAHAHPDPFLNSNAVAPQATIDSAVTESPGSVIGSYKLLEQIGEGGFGVVFMAEQTEPIRRKVALKILKAGMDTRQVVARFEAERQALALMDHPNIAKVLDGGTTESSRQTPSAVAEGSRQTPSAVAEGSRQTPSAVAEGSRQTPSAVAEGSRQTPSAVAESAADGTRSVPATVGRPYFVMELVKGIPITDYCDAQKLDTRERLQLFRQVCQAVQHAHMKGIIHRDIKPTNVLIAPHDGVPVVKVIDFGIAKALSGQLTDKTIYTGFAQMMGTPLYMSPEQAEINALDVDTRSDIYSLGVLMYELLTGTTPFEKERLSKATFDEMRKIIREEEPPRPSARISTMGKLATTASEKRKSDPRKLSHSLRGELDWIVMKALEKDRRRRYETANAFGADVQRYLNDEAVQARPATAWYRLRKFVRKHRGGALLVTMVTVFVLLTVVGLVVNNHMLRDEQARTEAARKDEAKRRQLARRALDAMSSALIEDWLAKQKELLPAQKEFLKLALNWYDELAEDTGRDVASRAGAASAHFRIGNIRQKLGQHREAEKAYRYALAQFQQLSADFPADVEHRRYVARCDNALGALLYRAGRLAEAEKAYLNAETVLTELGKGFPAIPGDVQKLAATHTGLGMVSWKTGRYEAAEQEYRKVFDLQAKLVHDFPTIPGYREDLAASHNAWAGLAQMLGHMNQAEKSLKEAISLSSKLVAELPGVSEYRNSLAVAHANLGELYRRMNRPEEAKQEYRKALPLQRQLAAAFPALPRYRDVLGTILNNLGNILDDDMVEQEKAYREALILRAQLARDFPNVPNYRVALGHSHHNLGDLFVRMGRYAAAEREYRKALEIQSALAANFPNVPEYRADFAMSRNDLGRWLWRRGQAAGAVEQWRQASKLQAQLVRDFPNVVEYRRSLATTCGNLNGSLQLKGRRLWEAGTLPEAEKTLREALFFCGKHIDNLPADDPRVMAIRQQCGWTSFYLSLVLNAAGKPKEAIQQYRETFKFAPGNRIAPANYWPRVALSRLLATCSDLKLRDAAEALSLAETAVKQKKQEAHGWSALGMALYRKGKWKASIDALEKAVKLRRNNDAVDWLFLAMAHWKRGDKDKARKWFERAIQWVDHTEPVMRRRGPIGSAMAAEQAGPFPLLMALQWKRRPGIGEDKGHDEELRVARAEAAGLLSVARNSRPAPKQRP